MFGERGEFHRIQVFVLTFALASYFSLVLGFQKSSGIFFIYFQDSFDASVTEISLGYSLASTMMYLGGKAYCILFSYSVSLYYIIVKFRSILWGILQIVWHSGVVDHIITVVIHVLYWHILGKFVLLVDNLL